MQWSLPRDRGNKGNEAPPGRDPARRKRHSGPRQGSGYAPRGVRSAMRSILVEGELSNVELAAVLQGAGVEQQTAAAYAFGTTRVALLVGRKFFFRSNDYLGLVVAAATDGRVQRIDISYAGGGSGLLGVQWGAGTDHETKVYLSLMERLRTRSLRCTDAPSVGGGDAPLPSSEPRPGDPA